MSKSSSWRSHPRIFIFLGLDIGRCRLLKCKTSSDWRMLLLIFYSDTVGAVKK